MTRDEALAYLRKCIEHAPPAEPTLWGLTGWQCMGVTICARCAGRIISRGCSLGDKPVPIWDVPVVCELEASQ